METAMRVAFENVRVTRKTNRKLALKVLDAAERGVGERKDSPKGWDARLSFRTYQDLKKEGVME